MTPAPSVTVIIAAWRARQGRAGVTERPSAEADAAAPTAEAPIPRLADLPDAAIVCRCNAVTKAAKPMIAIGAVGLGTGTVSTFVRPTDKLTFFEIDPMMVTIATDPKHFSYISECADGPINFVLGDARLTVTRQPNDQFDILLIDAFSSDAVPAHLLTVEAVKTYLTKIKPDGIVILHLSNRNLDLRNPAQAVAIAAGGHALLQLLRRHLRMPVPCTDQRRHCGQGDGLHRRGRQGGARRTAPARAEAQGLRRQPHREADPRARGAGQHEIAQAAAGKHLERA